MPSITFTVTRTGNAFRNPQRAVAIMDAALGVIGQRIRSDFEAVVSNWRNKPKFSNKTTKTADALTETIWPTRSDATTIYGYVELGTRPHKIAAKNAPTLAFMWGGPGSYQPKTTPGGGFGGPGTVVGGKMHFPREVNHPGNAPRGFGKKILKDETPWINTTLAAAWERAIKAMGG